MHIGHTLALLLALNAFGAISAGGYAMDTPRRSVHHEVQPAIRHGRSRSYFPRAGRHDLTPNAFDDDYKGGQYDDMDGDMSSTTQADSEESVTPAQGQSRRRDSTTPQSDAMADYVDYSRNEASGFVVERSTSPDEDGMEQSDQNVEFIEDKYKDGKGKSNDKDQQRPSDLTDLGGSLKPLDEILNEYENQPEYDLDSQNRPEDYELGATDSDFDSYDVKKDDPRRGQVDIVTRFLRIVESQHLLGENCTAGTDLNLGEGVVDRYAQERFRVEADVAVNRANMLTRIWKYADQEVMHSEYLLHASVFSMVEFDDDIFAAGNCYDQYQYKDYWLFCPFAYRLPEGPILVKDLAVEYKYLSNTSEWFYIARKNAENVIHNYNQFSRGFNTYTYNESAHTARVPDEILSVTYDDGKWSKPYYDCGGGNIWMLTYTVPFFGYNNGSYFFKGTSGIDIDLRRVDIDQCPLPAGSVELNIFAASDKCKKRTTECVPLPGLGFRRGSYKCLCRRGFYFPDTKAEHRYYNGTVIEEEYEKLMLDEENQYVTRGVFECLPCAEDCEVCIDDSPCVVSLNWVMRTAILILSCVVICCLPFVVLFTWKYGNVKVVRAASPVLLRVITLGALFIYCTTIVMYPRPSIYTCTLRVWLREIGFSLTYGALMLKTWRISVIFRVRSAKAVKITDMDLLKRLGVIVLIFSVFLVIRTLVAPPYVIVGRTADDLKAYLCRTDWWDHSFTTLEVMFLVWGIRLCIMVRKAPSEFNESRFISMAIYNEFLLSVFLNVSMLFLQSPANPDLLYIIFFCHTQLTVTLLLCIIFGSKAYMVFKGHDKLEESSNTKHKPQTAKFLSKGRSGNSACAPSTITNSSTTVGHLEYAKLKELDVQEEFQRLYTLLEQLREKNMRLGNRHLAAKISAMQEAARHNYTDTLHEEVETCDEHINSVLAAATEKIAIATLTTPSENGGASGQAFTLLPLAGNQGNKIALEGTGNARQDSTGRQPKKVSKKRCTSVGGSCLGETESDGLTTSDIIPSIDGNEVVANCNLVKCGCHWSESDGEKREGDDRRCVRCGGSRDLEGGEFVVSAGHGAAPSENNSRPGRPHKATHARTHAIVINLDDKNRFTDEVTV